MSPAANRKPESFIVCLDDDRDFLSSLKVLLPGKFQDGRDYNLLFFDNPVETLEILKEMVDQKAEIALLITDQVMPRMRGVDFLKAAREITPNSMRVLLTGFAGMDSAIVAINEDLLDKYLTKPITDLDDLVVTLKRLLNEFHMKNTVESQNRTILSLYEFSNNLNSLRSEEKILEQVIEFTRDSLNCERISVLVLEEGELVYKAGMGIPENVASQIRIPVGKNISGRVLKERKPLLVRDIEEIPWITNKINPEFKSFISAPLACAELYSVDLSLGVINVTNKGGNEEFSSRDLETLSFIANTAAIALNNQHSLRKVEQGYLDTVQALIAALEARDEYTKGHSMRVMNYSLGIARHLRLGQEMLRLVKDAAILHDIGKIGIRDDILLKAGRLAPEELLDLRRHPEISSSIVKSISSLQEVGLIVRSHHEMYDGGGYPDGLKGEEIHFGGRILAVADAFDAMTSNRPYRKALDFCTSMEELKKKAGTQFDPSCVDAMLLYLEGAEDKTSHYSGKETVERRTPASIPGGKEETR